MSLQVTTGQIDEVHVVDLVGAIDGASAPQMQTVVVPLIQDGVRMVLDLSQVDYMSSAGLRVLLLVFRQVSAKGGKVALTGLSEEIRDTMSLTGFLDFFAAADTRDAAVQTVRE